MPCAAAVVVSVVGVLRIRFWVCLFFLSLSLPRHSIIYLQIKGIKDKMLSRQPIAPTGKAQTTQAALTHHR